MNTLTKPELVIDTPNVLFHHKQREGQTDKNLLALMNFILVNRTPMICVITPLMLQKFKEQMDLIKSIIESNHGTIVYSYNEDPDIIVLQIAENQDIPILSNDKFKQSKYKKFKSRTNRIGFKIKNAALNIISVKKKKKIRR